MFLKVYQRNFDESIDRYAGMVQYLSDAVKYAGVALKNGELVLQAKDAGASKLDTASEKAIKNKYWSNYNHKKYTQYVFLHKHTEGKAINTNDSKYGTRIMSIQTSKGDGRKIVFLLDVLF